MNAHAQHGHAGWIEPMSGERRSKVKSRLSTLGFVLILGALILSACSQVPTQTSEPAVATPTQVSAEAPATEEPTALPTAAPMATATQAPPTAQPTQAPTVAPTEVAVEPEELAKEEVAGWKTYTNERYGYSHHDPEGQSRLKKNAQQHQDQHKAHRPVLQQQLHALLVNI